jgi:hypothetical protein
MARMKKMHFEPLIGVAVVGLCTITFMFGAALVGSMNWKSIPVANTAAVEYCLLWVPHWSMCMTKSEWATWVQGVGTVAAIAVSAGFVLWQHRNDKKKKEAAEISSDLQKIELMRSSLNHFYHLARHLKDDLLKGSVNDEVAEEVTFAYTVVRDLPKDIAPNAYFRFKWAHAQYASDHIHTALMSLYGGRKHKTIIDADRLVLQMQTAATVVQEVTSDLDKAYKNWTALLHGHTPNAPDPCML